MPLHFNSIMKKDLENEVFSGILQYDLENPDNALANDSKDKFMVYKNIIDENTKNIIGKTTITFITRNNAHEVVDVDITLNSNNKITLLFDYKYESDSEGNEYYQVVNDKDTVHFDVETVNRFKINGNIENSKQEVNISVFPFQLDIYDNIDELNKTFGFEKEIKALDNLKVNGFSDKFMGSGSGILMRKEYCSFIIGYINDFKDVKTKIGNIELEFTIIDLETEIGIIPIACSKDNFDIRNIKKGMILATLADVKAEF